jgi:HK97 family phage major capsid protein
MKKTFIRLTLALLALIGLAFVAGVIHPVTALIAAGCVQLVAFSVAAPQARLFISILTPEQVKEFGEILDGLKEYRSVLPKLKNAPHDIEQLGKKLERLDELQRTVDNLRRMGLGGGGREIVPAGSFVSDNCARALVGLAIVAGHRKGNFDLLESGKRETIMSMGKSFLGEAQFKTALSSSDIPLPVGYSGEVVALVGMYGSARRYGTVFPAGSGQLKLPRLKTDPAFGLLGQSTPITEKSPQTEWVTFNAEKFGGLIRLPSEMDEDSVIALGNFIADYAARQIALSEDWQFFVSTGVGSGVNGSVEGLCTSVVTNSKTTVSGSLGSPAEFTLAHFRAVRTVPAASALRQGAYYLHPTFEPLLASFNNSTNGRPYNPNAQIQGTGAQPFVVGPTLDGFPIRWIDVMPVYSTSDVLSTVHVLFGDARFQYLAPRGGVRFQTSVDAAFETDEILMKAVERFTIGLMATGAMGGLITHSA